MGKTERGGNPPESGALRPLLAPLLALGKLLEHFDNQGVVIGGIAASLLGQPRLTADLDAIILLSIDDLPELMNVAREQGIVPRIEEAEIFARKNRVLLLQHASSRINIDISLGMLPFESEMVARSQAWEIENLRIRLPTPEDLIILKAVANRPQDLVDIQAVAASNPELDQERVRFWVEQFGETLEIPDLWEQVSKLL